MGKTSTEVKRRYNEKVYRQLSVQIPKELFEKFREHCEEIGEPQRQVLIHLIQEFLAEK